VYYSSNNFTVGLNQWEKMKCDPMQKKKKKSGTPTFDEIRVIDKINLCGMRSNQFSLDFGV